MTTKSREVSGDHLSVEDAHAFVKSKKSLNRALHERPEEKVLSTESSREYENLTV